MANLSEEIIVEILLRLPVTSLCRFRCVSKQWLSLISDPKFIKSHLNRNTNEHEHEHEHERLVLVSARVSGSRGLYSVDLKSFQFLDDFEAVHLKFPPKQISSGCYVILGSCDGLLLMLDVDDYISCFLVNPSTRECKELPKSPFQCHPECFFDSYGLGYDSSNDDYKVVRISHYAEGVDDIVSVYTLRTNSWRRIEDSPLFKGPSPGILVSGALHWFACSGVGSNKSTVIASFDLADENFRDVPFPGFVDDFFSFKELNVVGGCLCVVVSSHIGFTDVWVMKEYGVRDSWTKLTINYNNNFPLCKPLCLSATGEFLLQNQDKKVPKLVLYNPQEKTSKELVVRGGPNYYEAGIYIESLVSPNCSNMIMKQ